MKSLKDRLALLPKAPESNLEIEIPSEERHYFSKNNKPDEVHLNHSVIRLIQDESLLNLADAPIFSWRIFFGIIALLKSEQFSVKNETLLKQFSDDLQTEKNTYFSITMKTSDIDKYQNVERIKKALIYLEMAFNKYITEKNYLGQPVTSQIKLVSEPVISKGKVRFRTSVYWLQKLCVLTGYNSVLYSLPFIINNSKYISISLMLSTLSKEHFTPFKIKTLQERYLIPKYKNNFDIDRFFLKPLRDELNTKNSLSFTYHFQNDILMIKPYLLKNVAEKEISISESTKNKAKEKYTLHYIKMRYKLDSSNSFLLSSFFKNGQTRETETIIKAYKDFVSECRKKKIKSDSFLGNYFLNELQKKIIENYKDNPAYSMLPNGYIRII